MIVCSRFPLYVAEAFRARINLERHNSKTKKQAINFFPSVRDSYIKYTLPDYAFTRYQ